MNQENHYSESMLKGRMAESMVEELLKKSGNTVYRFGYEAIMQNLTQIKKNFDAHSDVGERIRAIPDFIVIDVSGNPVFVEVKFRWNGIPHADDMARFEKIREFWSAKIIFVSSLRPPFFQISNPPYIDDKGKLIQKPLCKETSWKIDQTIYDEMEGLVRKYLSQSLFPLN
jgi:Holliday junction resolvase-like predicted endonuclease